MIESLIGLAILLVVAFLGFPLGFSMLTVGFVGFGLLRGFEPALKMVSQEIVGLALNFSFAVLPLFMLMGVFVARARLSDDLYEASNSWLGHFKGGLAMATVAACGGFAAVSGSSLASAATMAKVAISSMRRFGYADSLSAGTVAAGGTMGILIPPSSALIVYGILTETDIAKLFVGGILPGLLTITLYILVIAIVVRIWPKIGPPGLRSNWAERFSQLGKVWGVVALFILILGGIFMGVFTPSEAGGIGAAGALLFAIGRRKMSWAAFVASLLEAARTTAIVFTIAFGTLVLNQFVNIAGLPDAMVAFIQSLEVAPTTAVLMILLIYVVLGTVIEGFSLIFLTAPIFAPVMLSLGFDLIWFGIFMVMVVEISVITPPIGLNVFVLKSMLPEVPLYSIFRGILPFFCADIVRVVAILYFPIIVLFLPNLMR